MCLFVCVCLHVFVHMCMCELPLCVLLLWRVSMDVCVCCTTNIHVCCTCLSLSLCMSACSGVCHCRVVCLPLFGLFALCVLHTCECVLSVDVHVWCACLSLCLCVPVCLGPFFVCFALCVCVCMSVSPLPCSAISGSLVTPCSLVDLRPSDWQAARVPHPSYPARLGCANHWVTCRWQMCGSQAWRRDCVCVWGVVCR